ncbi:MAG: DUF58 domain-containing protein [Gammaproteobacteria bacterium]
MTEYTVLEHPPRLAGGITSGSRPYKRQRIYIFPSRHGLFFSLILVVMLLGAINYNNSMAYVLTFLLVSLFMTDMLHTYHNLRGLILSSRAGRPVFAGETACFPVLVDNRSEQKRTALDIAPYPKRRKGNHHLAGLEPLTVNIAANGLQREHLKIPTHRRGYLKPGRFRIVSTYPLGLFRAWSYLESHQTCLVYPKPAGTHRLPLLSSYDAEEQIGPGSGTDDFTGTKPYRPGDSIHAIDWKVLARERGLVIKRFNGSGARRLLLHWDQCAHLRDVEQRLSQLCLWIIEAERTGVYYGLQIPGNRIDPGRGESHHHRCLKALATYGVDATNP